MKRERNCLIALNLLLVLLAILLASSAQAQALKMPAHLSRDPEYWWNQYTAEHARAEAMGTAGTTAIKGLTSSLTAANDTIARQNKTITTLAGARDTEWQRAETAERNLRECEGRQPKTWAGRKLKRIGETTKNVLAGVGVVTVTVLTLSAVL